MKKFLLLDEIVEDKNVHLSNINEEARDCMVNLENVTTRWPSSLTKGHVLTDLSFTVEAGQLMVIVGQVGVRKSKYLNFYETNLVDFLSYLIISFEELSIKCYSWGTAVTQRKMSSAR